jgi:glycosyltransferase involved in cell wall biosynthesis
MNRELTVSIILTCYNGQNWIKETIESVIEQTFEDFQLIIVNDGSIDDSEKIIKPFLFDPRITYFYQPNRGIPGARNAGLNRAIGKYICILDQDDLWLNNKLERQVHYLNRHPQSGMVYANAYHIDEDGNIFGLRNPPDTGDQKKTIEKLIVKGNFMPIVTAMIRRKCFDQVGFFDEQLYGCDDYDFWLRLASQFDFGFIKAPLAKLRYHHESSWHSEKMFIDRLSIAQKIKHLYPDKGNLIRKNRARVFYDYGHFFSDKLKKKQAAKMFLISILINPFSPRAYYHLFKSIL